MSQKSKKNQINGLHEVRTAGYTATKKVKRDKTVNRRAGLHDKAKNLEGEVRVKRRKPLELKHVRRMRKIAAVASIGIVGAVGVFGVGFFKPAKDITLDGDFATVYYAPPTDNSKPTEHTLVEAVGYMNYTLQNQSYWSSDAVTTVIAAGFEQEVKNYKQYYDEVLVSADISIGFVNYGEQFCQTKGVVLSRMAATNKPNELQKGMNTAWSTGPATGMTVKAFKQNRGLPPYDFSVYVLNEKTIANAYDTTIVDNGDGTYSMQLELNVNTGVDETCAEYYYKLQQKVNGTLYDVPTFYTASISYVFDENWRVLSFEINDTSKTPKSSNLVVNSSSNTKTNFHYDESSAYNTFWQDYYEGEYDRLKDTLSDDDVVEENLDNALNYLSNAFASVLTEGAVLKVDLNIDNLNLNGVVNVEMEDGLGLSAKLGDILVWLDGNTLYITDGSSKYKLNTDKLLSSSGEGGSPLDGLDITGLMNQITDGTFTLDKETGIATLVSEVELFGLKIPMNFEFQKTSEGVVLNFLEAEISLGEKTVNAKLCFGDESDKPAIPEDTAAYKDVLNDGVAFDINVEVGGLSLDGIAKILTANGDFAGVYATLGDFTIYYDCPRNMLYLSDKTAKYKLDISKLNSGNNSEFSLPAAFDINSLLSGILSNLYTTENSLGSSLDINIDALESVLKAALDIRLFGGLKVDADLTFDKLNLSMSATLTDKDVALPSLEGYQDILNGTVTLDVNLTLLTGLEDEQGNRDSVNLSGKVALVLSGGNLSEIRADFDGFAVYYEFASQSLYLKVGTTKVMLNFAEMDMGDTAILSTFAGGNFLSMDLPTVIKELLTNLIAEGQSISTSMNLTLADAIVPLWATVDLSNGLGLDAGLTVFGIDAVAGVKLSEIVLDGLGDEEKEEYINVLKEGQKVIESLIGSHISATVSGTLYSQEEKYSETDGVKYNFNASLAYDKGSSTVGEEGKELDSKAYIHLNIGLTARHPDDESLFIDLTLMDANPVTDGNGRTTGGYTQDGKFDIYLSVSKYAENAAPLLIYAPVDEILTIVSMLGATINLDEINVENSKELTALIGKISEVLDGMLISQYLPKSLQDKFASLGDSLIPQILGVSLEDLLNKLFGNIDATVQNTTSLKISLAENYVSSITTTDETLKFVLNSALIYNNDNMTEEDNVTVTFERVLIDGTYFVGGVNLENIFFGKNEVNKLNLGLNLDYGEVVRPDAATAFSGYMNADGLDKLLESIVNSATHKVDGKADEYELNHYYLINGQINASLSIIGIEVDIAVNINSAAVYIDPVTNAVSADVHISYAGKKVLFIEAICGTSDVYLTIRDGMVYIKRIQTTDSSNKAITPITITRVVPLNDFLSSGNIMNHISFIFNFGSMIADELAKIQMGETGVSFVDKDFGASMDYILASYSFTETDNQASWTFGIKGGDLNANNGLLTDAVGMKMSNIPISFVADKNADGTLTVKQLNIAGAGDNRAQMNLMSGISLKFYGSLNYVNPCSEIKEESDDSEDLSTVWEEAFDCAGNEIPSTELWNKLLGIFGKDYLEVGGQIRLGTVRFEYFDLNGDRVELGQRQRVFYNAESKEFYSDVNIPELPVYDGTQVVWDDEYYVDAEGYLVYRAVAYRVNYNSDVAFNGGNYSVSEVYTGSGNSLLEVTATEGGVNFLGWFLADGDNYKLITSQDQLKEYVIENAGVAIDINLWAVWYNPTVTGEVSEDSYYKYNNLFSKTWYVKGKIELPFSGKSLEIYNNTSDLKLSIQIKYGISKNGVSMSNDLNGSNKYENTYADGSFEKTISSTHGNDKGSYSGGNVKVTITLNGKTIQLNETGVWGEYKNL